MEMNKNWKQISNQNIVCTFLRWYPSPALARPSICQCTYQLCLNIKFANTNMFLFLYLESRYNQEIVNKLCLLDFPSPTPSSNIADGWSNGLMEKHENFISSHKHNLWGIIITPVSFQVPGQISITLLFEDLILF